MLEQLLKSKKCFKLICGAGNENLQEVERLVALYAKAGCHFFDLCANTKVLEAAQRGLDFTIPKKEQENYHFCLSTGIKDEPHLNKTEINLKKCIKCKKCIDACPQNAINENFKVNETKCIGCLRCVKTCRNKAINIYSKCKPINEILDDILKKQNNPKLSCIELHASGQDEADFQQRWEYLQSNFDGMLSLCIDRSQLSNEKIINRIKRIVEKREPYTTIIQADGAPMTGGKDDYKTTLQSVAMAEIIQNANLPLYILLSGGTNSKTSELAKLCGIDFNGISVGSYARKIVKKYIEREDFLKNDAVFDISLKTASNLVKSI